ncbi:O-acetyl-ADP-ribose deacetylase [Candidatus Hodarchaeum mangrovi]
MEKKLGSSIIKLVKGDITKEETDVIVNAANPSLRGGGGVDGAIHHAGGQQILKECIAKYPSGCNPGEARITSGGLLKTKWVIHTPGPIWKGGNRGESTILRNSYKNSLLLAEEYSVSSIAFPSISTGIYGYPIEYAAEVAIKTVLEVLSQTNIKRIHFVLFSDSDYYIYKQKLESIINEFEK